jgi:hypothetical protein
MGGRRFRGCHHSPVQYDRVDIYVCHHHVPQSVIYTRSVMAPDCWRLWKWIPSTSPTRFKAHAWLQVGIVDYALDIAALTETIRSRVCDDLAVRPP